MRPIFDNGATRDRARAWALWLALAAAGAGWAGMADGWTARDGGLLLAALGLAGRVLLVRRQPRRIPILNYHSISGDPAWLQIADQVSMPPVTFERHLAYLRQHGYRTLFVSEVHEALAGRIRLDPRERWVALTFDDGYADNWMAAYPLLKQYGMKATVFVSTGFVTAADGCRPTSETAAGGRLDWSGYLTWPELRAMRASGLVEIQAHGAAHTRVFTGPELKGFIGPGRPNPWLFWNARPADRPRWWRTVGKDRSLWGQPVFRQAPALGHRAWHPDPETVTRLLDWAWADGGECFARPDWEACLHEEWQSLTRGCGIRGTHEDDGAYARRLEDDLGEAKRALERELGVTVTAVCWPENAFSAVGEQVARKLGYTVTVSNRHGSRNVVGEAPGTLVRVFMGSRAAGIRSPRLDVLALVLELKVFEGWYVGYPVLAAMHRARKLAMALEKRCRCRRDCYSTWD